MGARDSRQTARRSTPKLRRTGGNRAADDKELAAAVSHRKVVR